MFGKTLQSFGYSAFRAAIICALTASCAQRQANKLPEAQLATRYSSPQEVFDAYREARNKRDWRKSFECLTAEAQNDAIFEAVIACAESGDSRVKAIAEKYFVNDGTTAGAQDAERDAARNPNPDALRDLIAARIRDKAGYFEAVSNLLTQGELIQPIGALEQLTIDDDAAKARATVIVTHYESSPGVPERKVEDKVYRDYQFRLVGGGWLIDAT